jgi:hypothetical protein
MAQGFPELDNWQSDLLIRIPVHIHTTWDSNEWTPMLDGEIWQKGVFFCSVIKPWLITYVWGKPKVNHLTIFFP